MEQINVFWHEGMLKHETGKGVFDSGIDPGFLDVLEKYPKNSDRIKNMVSILKRGPISPFISWHSGRSAVISDLFLFHTQDVEKMHNVFSRTTGTPFAFSGSKGIFSLTLKQTYEYTIASSLLSYCMEKINVFWHEGMLKHETGKGVFDSGIDPGFLDVLEKHPENSDRIKNMVSILKRGPISPFISWHSGRPAIISDLLLFHTQEYINELLEADKKGVKEICPGTFLNSGSWDATLLAAGTTLSAMKYILDGEGKFSYALVRPPGHHAQPSQADGYCFFNNAGLAVNMALKSGCEKVAVIDIDVHYGNGTAEGFYHSDRVLTISLHMNHGSWGPSHPQSGTVDALGEGNGLGYNLNIPLPNGTGDKGYGYAMQELVLPAVNNFKPDIMVLVVGQDSSAFDPNGRQCLTMDGYRDIGRSVRHLAEKHCRGRILIVQEGGYHVTYSAYCLHATLEGVLNVPSALLSDPIAYYPDDESFSAKVIDSIKNYHLDNVPFMKKV